MIGRHGSLRRPLAETTGVSRASLYYRARLPPKDWALKQQIEAALREHPAYGHKRLAVHLRVNKKRILRVMHLFGLEPYRRRGKKWHKAKEKLVQYPNLLLIMTPTRPHHVWVADFTYLNWKGRVVYVGTVMDVFTRRVVGISVLTTHATVLVVQALWNALLFHPKPEIFHSDNGSEYNAATFRGLLRELDIVISRSAPGCPWENGYQESFYGKFKLDLGDPNRFGTLAELVLAVYQTIHVYNTSRIHTALRMAPNEFAKIATCAILKTTFDSVS